MGLTDEQITMSRHALGLTDGRTTSYRNRYVASLGSDQEAAWDDLVSLDYATRGKNGHMTVGFCLTLAGATAVLQAGEALDREDFPELGRAQSEDASRKRGE